MGLLVGCVLVVGLIGGVLDLRSPTADRPNTGESTCRGASVRATLDTGPGRSSDLVTAQVLIYDDPARDWQVSWRGFELPIATVNIGLGEPVGQAFALLGDHDDGSTREIWLRPEGDETWCKVETSLPR
ncbi:hypothetical protein GCM10023349_05590 [Nocardioides conyzicola]|uniref:Uncharacterized protein n=1 Tax=Nocardioides conyzicola TaxID=1651781 RepID=A0ABP8WPQ0_9ACTN